MSAPIEVAVPEKLAVLWEPHRYKVLYSGRGAGKSWGVARAALIQSLQQPLRWLCARELQKSIDESVHHLFAEQIRALDLTDCYEVLNTEIRGRNGSHFGFCGLRHNVAQLKSYEGVDRCWVEEAQTVSKSSWEILIPTIRQPGSEIWVTFNPELESDETYRRFVVAPPPDAAVIEMNWRDNPWFPAVLRQEMQTLKERDPDAYLTVWEGKCRQVLDGAIYAKEIREATAAGRITRVPHDPRKPVDTYWDLGYSDYCAIWFAQPLGLEYRVVDYYQSHLESLQHYLKMLQSKPYVYGVDWLPHDGRAKQLGTGKSIEEMMREAGRKVRIVPNLSLADGIAATRALFPMCYFDSTCCAEGLNALRRYRYKRDESTGQYSKLPLHDESSHAADAFRYLALAIKQPASAKPLRGQVFEPFYSDMGY